MGDSRMGGGSEATPPTVPFGPWRGALLALVVGVGAFLLAAPPLHPAAPIDMVRLAGATLCAYALFVVLAWFPVPWLSRRIESLFEDVVDEGQAGWYLAVAVAHFALAEVADAVARWGTAPSVEGWIREGIVQHLIGFSVESFMNALWASLWPMTVFREHGGPATVALAAFAWLLFAAGRLAFGETRVGGAATG